MSIKRLPKSLHHKIANRTIFSYDFVTLCRSNPTIRNMKIPNLGFSLVEKFAIVQAVDSVIIADGTIHTGEIDALSQLMSRIDFESNFILQARNMSQEQGHIILRDMPYKKKKALATILEEIAISDGWVHEKESALMSTIFSYIGIGQEAKAAK